MIFLSGKRVEQTGPIRSLITPPLLTDKHYVYDGQMQHAGRTAEFQLPLRAGANLEHSLEFRGQELLLDGKPVVALSSGKQQQAGPNGEAVTNFGLCPERIHQGEAGRIHFNGHLVSARSLGDPTTVFDDANKPFVTIFTSRPEQRDAALKLLEPHSKQFRLNVYDPARKEHQWALGPFKLDQDREYRKTRFKVLFQGPPERDGRGQELYSAYEPSPELLSQGLRKIDPHYDPNPKPTPVPEGSDGAGLWIVLAFVVVAVAYALGTK
jgi:hypothetical protein